MITNNYRVIDNPHLSEDEYTLLIRILSKFYKNAAQVRNHQPSYDKLMKLNYISWSKDKKHYLVTENAKWFTDSWRLAVEKKYKRMAMKAYKKYMRSQEWQRLRKEVYERDHYKCRLCGSNDRIGVHHIAYYKFPYPEVLDYLLTVCYECHRRISFGRIIVYRE